MIYEAIHVQVYIKIKGNIPHYPQDHKEQMLHYVAKNHFSNQEASVMALDHRYEQYPLDYEFPENKKFFSVSAKKFTRPCHSFLRTRGKNESTKWQRIML